MHTFFLRCRAPAYNRGMEERVVLNESGVLVSNARFVTPQATYALAQITSVRTEEGPSEESGGGYVVLGGLIFFAGVMTLSGDVSWLARAAVFAIGAGLATLGLSEQRKTKGRRKHFVVVTTSAGQVPALFDYDRAWIGRVAEAITVAIVSRG